MIVKFLTSKQFHTPKELCDFVNKTGVEVKGITTGGTLYTLFYIGCKDV